MISLHRGKILPIILLLIGMSILISSCASIGPRKLLSNHIAYNTAVQLSVGREVLANIVRSRYSDPMQFVAVSAINAQISFNVKRAVNVGGIGNTGAVGTLDGSRGYSDSPTITFVPLSDAGFYKSFYEPFDITETIGFGFSYRFAQMEKEWQILSMRLSFASINGATDFSNGKRTSHYEKRIAALEYLIDNGATFQQVSDWDYDTLTIAKESITAEDSLGAFKSGFSYVDEGDGSTVRLARRRFVLALSLAHPSDPKIIAALENLGVTPGQKKYILRPPSHAIPGELSSTSIWVTPRSMADLINFATQYVEVPEVHNDIVLPIESNIVDSSNLPQIKIHYSKDKPDFPFRIQHRNFWFYIDDRELESKIFFESLVAAYSSRLGSKNVEDGKPQVVLPIGY